MLKWQYGDSHRRIQYFSGLIFRFCRTTVSNIMIILYSGAMVACNRFVPLDIGLLLALQTYIYQSDLSTCKHNVALP